MPRYVLNTGSIETAREFHALSPFAQGCFECALWADEEQLAEEGCEGASLSDISPDLWTRLALDCLVFETVNAADLDAAEEAGRDREHLGHDFWLSRNGHGTGFWDRGLGELGDRLHAAAQRTGGLDLYVGDDGLIYG